MQSLILIVVTKRSILTPLGVRVCFKQFRTIKQLLSHQKNATPDLQRSEVVYKIPCANCSASYVGQTDTDYNNAYEEHKHTVRQADFNFSALAVHT